jgi:Phospholipase_D-nuclease N-terminal
VRLVLPIIVALVLAIYAFIDCLQADPAEVRGPRRPVWIAMILLLPIVGPVSWLVARRGMPRTGRPQRYATPPVAPDDNPEFLRQLRDIDDQHEELLSQWEDDLRRREEEMRDKNGDELPKNRGDEGGDDTSRS